MSAQPRTKGGFLIFMHQVSGRHSVYAATGKQDVPILSVGPGGVFPAYFDWRRCNVSKGFMNTLNGSNMPVGGRDDPLKRMMIGRML